MFRFFFVSSVIDTIKISEIPDMDLRRVDVTVAFADYPVDILAEVSGFIAPRQTSLAAGGTPGIEAPQSQGSEEEPPPATLFGTGWAPLDPNAEYATGATR